MTDLETIIELAHEFVTEDVVKGGGGNTSVKNEETLWVKPSGTTLGGLTTETFVAMNRIKINERCAVETPAESAGREERLKNMMAAAVENDPGEMLNLVNNPEYTDVLKKHRNLLAEWGRISRDKDLEKYRK